MAVKLHGYEVHPLAAAFPLLDDEGMRRLVADIKANGLQCPITLFEDQIIDGRNRAIACQKAKVEPDFEEVTGVDPAAFVVSMNLHRRHLDESQRSMVTARLARMAVQNKTADRVDDAIEENRERLNVGRSSAYSALKVLDAANPVLTKAVDDGVLPVSQAAKLAKQDTKTQNAAVARVRETGRPAAVMSELKREQVRETNAKEELNGRYSVILADPPWQYSNTGLTGSAEEQYPTMPTPEICALPIGAHATENAVLFLWVTNPMQCDGVEVAHAWGFEPKTKFVWVKNRAAPAGFYCRSRTEDLWVCTRGEGMTVAPENLPDNVIEAAVRKHSEKPDRAYEVIEDLYPKARKLELFARKRRKGWNAFGNEL